jgi:AAA15 family ATPase/GTPase
MIQEFSIENTYSIKTRQTISFEAAGGADDAHCINVGGKKLLKLAALYGANASGKSNIIKAFNFYMNFITDSFTYLKPKMSIPFTPFLFDEKCKNSAGCFEIVFYLDDTQYKYEIALDTKKVIREDLIYFPENKEEILFSRIAASDGYDWKFGEQLSDIEQIKQIKNITRHNAAFLDTASQLNHFQLGNICWDLYSTKKIIDSDYQYTDLPLLYLENEISIHDIIDLLKKASIDDINNIILDFKEDTKSNASHEEIYFSHKFDKEYILPYSSESGGTRRFFNLIGPLFDSIKSKTNLFIDEIETSLHDDLLEFFISTFLNNSTRSQLLFTTHNQSLLDSELLSNDEIWFVQKDKTGGSEFFSLAEFKDIPPGVSRRKLYKAGTFGALPFISTYTRDT